MMRASNCPTKLYVNVNVEIDDKKKTLTIFDEVLKATLGDFDHQSAGLKILQNNYCSKKTFL